MVKVVVAGAAGGIGQSLSLLFKLSPYVTELSLYDVVNSPGVAADLGHINTGAIVKGYLAYNDDKEKHKEELKNAFTNANLVIIPAGIPRKPGMTRDDLFKINAGIVRDLVQASADYSPNAFILIISNPVNSTVPVAAEVLKKAGVFNPQKLFGVTTLDVVRANTFLAQINNPENPSPEKENVQVIGGHSGETIVPLFSIANSKTYKTLESKNELDELIKHVQFGGDEVVKAKDGKGSATLSMAYAGFKFAESILKASKGETGIIENTYVHLSGIKNGDVIKEKLGVDYFSLPVEFGINGVKEIKIDILTKITDKENELIKIAVDQLKGNITKGANFILESSKI